jgi:inner membrane protein
MPEQPLTTAASEANAPRPSRLSWVRRSFSFRGSVVAILVLLLLIPLGMVQDLIRERADRKSEAEMEISRTWGGAQTLLGPVIDVPYDVPVQVLAADGAHTVTRLETRYMHFLPEDLEMNALLEPHEKRRGIYSVALYGSTTTIKGSFAPISSQRTESGGALHWDQARVALGITDLRSIKQQVTMHIGGRTLEFEPGLPNQELAANGLSAAFPVDPSLLGQPLAFTTEVVVRGSVGFDLVPVGKVTRAHAMSTWNDPSFQGAFLPEPRDSAASSGPGFSATWTVLHLNRPYPQQFAGDKRGEMEASAFGVRLMQPVDEYQKSTRATKYGIMLIVMVFLVFFFVEVLQQLSIHPIQYLLVGFALCLFYTLLIALSEHIGFAKAYVLSGTSVIGLVVLYARGVFQVARAARLLGLIMLLVFGFMFALIHEQDYALLFGSLGLFIVLALVMWVSRRIDWNGGHGAAAGPGSPR